MSDLPDPLVPPYCDMRSVDGMPLDTNLVNQWPSANDAEAWVADFMAAVVAWHEVPAGSVPDDNRRLAWLLGYGKREAKTVEDLRSKGALESWIKCNDGRLYLPWLCEHVKRMAKKPRQARAVNDLRPTRTLDVSPNEWRRLRAQIFLRDNFTCRYCYTTSGQMECDHVIPSSRGGLSTPSNLVTACWDCNRAKSHSMPASEEIN